MTRRLAGLPNPLVVVIHAVYGSCPFVRWLWKGWKGAFVFISSGNCHSRGRKLHFVYVPHVVSPIESKTHPNPSSTIVIQTRRALPNVSASRTPISFHNITDIALVPSGINWLKETLPRAQKVVVVESCPHRTSTYWPTHVPILHQCQEFLQKSFPCQVGSFQLFNAFFDPPVHLRPFEVLEGDVALSALAFEFRYTRIFGVLRNVCERS